MLIVQYYEDKIGKFRSGFREFRFEMCQQFRQVVGELRGQIGQIGKDVQKCREV